MSLPYVVAARDYLNAGWSPIPLPPKEKHPVPEGFTGASGKYVDELQLKRWLNAGEFRPSKNRTMRIGNLALRLPKDVLGIDVDAYGEKKGEQTFAAALDEWGSLPDTWVSTSRTDGRSGIRFYRIPTGLAWPGELPQGKGVELLRWDHRYAIVAPSIHDKTGATYAWYHEQYGELDAEYLVEGEIPDVDKLPALPREWVDGLTTGRKWVARAANTEMGDDACRRWLSGRNDPDSPCAAMRATVAKHRHTVRLAGEDGGAHDSVRDAVWAVVGDAGVGHTGVHEALAQLRRTFLEAVKGRRGNDRIAKQEWARTVIGGVQKVAAEENPDEQDPCESISARGERRKSAGGKSKGSKMMTWRMDDIGNAERLIRTMDGRARYVEATGRWMVWSDEENRWVNDNDGQVARWSVKTVNNMTDELAYLEQDGTKEEVIKAFRAHIKASGNYGRLEAMVKVARSRKGISARAEMWDDNPFLLGVPNGIIELSESWGAKLRDGEREDYVTLRTRGRYDPDAKAPRWNRFIRSVQPDKAARRWLQMLVGYSLLGVNPQRLIVAVVGPTSTGKTTFTDAVSWALGQYGGPMPASVLRDNPDDKPRPDLLDALPRRMVVAEELGAAQHLHPDQIKRLTGGSVIPARGMRSNYVYRKPSFTPWLVSNSAPTINGADLALWKRLVMIPFNTVVESEDIALSYALREEADGILMWCLGGYLAWVNLGRPALPEVMPASLATAQREFRDQLSVVDTFIAEACLRGEGNAANTTQLFQAYTVWCDLTGVKRNDRVSMNDLSKELKSKGYVRKNFRTDDGPRHMWDGLAPNDTWNRG